MLFYATIYLIERNSIKINYFLCHLQKTYLLQYCN